MSLNNRYILFIWIILPALLLGWLVSSYYKDFFLVSAKADQEEALSEVPKDLPTIKPFKAYGKGALTIWFNNGWKSQLKIGLPTLTKNKLKAAVSVVASYTDYPAYINWDEIKNLQNKGWEVISQGQTYNCDWGKLSSDQVRGEVYGSKRAFFAHGIRVDNFSSSCGLVDIRLTDRVAYYYSSQKIGEEGSNQFPLENVFLLKGRTITSKTTNTELESFINQAKSNNQWLILTFNQINDSDDSYSISEAKFKLAIEEIAKSGMDIVLPAQVIETNKKEGS